MRAAVSGECFAWDGGTIYGEVNKELVVGSAKANASGFYEYAGAVQVSPRLTLITALTARHSCPPLLLASAGSLRPHQRRGGAAAPLGSPRDRGGGERHLARGGDGRARGDEGAHLMDTHLIFHEEPALHAMSAPVGL